MSRPFRAIIMTQLRKKHRAPFVLDGAPVQSCRARQNFHQLVCWHEGVILDLQDYHTFKLLTGQFFTFTEIWALGARLSMWLGAYCQTEWPKWARMMVFMCTVSLQFFHLVMISCVPIMSNVAFKAWSVYLFVVALILSHILGRK